MRSFLVSRVIRLYPHVILSSVVASVGIWLILIIFPQGHIQYSSALVNGNKSTLVSLIVSCFVVNSGWFAQQDAMSVNGPTWYISVLMICYAIYCLILRYCRGDRTRENACIVFVVLTGIYLYLSDAHFYPLLYPSCGRGYVNFFLGVLVAQLVSLINTEGKRMFALAGSVALFALFFLMFHYNLLGPFGVAASLVLFPSLLVFLTSSRLFERLAENKVVSYLGKISFSVYLWNIPVAIWTFFIQDVFGWNANYASKRFFFGTILVTVVVAVFAYEYFEKPVQRKLREIVKF